MGLGYRKPGRCAGGGSRVFDTSKSLPRERSERFGYHLHSTPAFPAGLDIDVEDTLKPLRLYALWVQVIDA